MNAEVKEQERHLASVGEALRESTIVKEAEASAALDGETQAMEPEKKASKKTENAGKYMVLVKNDSSGSWWGEFGVFDIANGDPKKQALESSSELQAQADDGGVTLKAVPKGSWDNEKTYAYDRVLREVD